ncbi:hypothetical protein [Evansella clarkii]|uniref:hypothetical protein n=1 Tax=Evansella clarkii TaxID=79879 RepID=UPI0009986D18|nr:hypothetical protein [Evansella clarkii]
MKDTPAIQSVSSMNHLFLKTVTGKINYGAVNHELIQYIKIIAERYYTIDTYSQKAIIRGIKKGEYFKDVPSDQVEQTLNDVIQNLTGEKYDGVAHYYAYLIETAHSN